MLRAWANSAGGTQIFNFQYSIVNSGFAGSGLGIIRFEDIISVSGNFSLNHIDHLFGNVGGVVCDPFQMPRYEEEIDQIAYALGLFLDCCLTFVIKVSLLYHQRLSAFICVQIF